MTEQTLEQKVLAELLRLRKLSTGVTVEALTRTVTICDLLGAGDPFVAYTRLTHEVLDSDLDLSVRAAATSLGLLSAEDTHLKRLDALGDEIGLEARQVRRYSDRGIRTLARLIASNWPTETVPQLSVSLVHVAGGWEIHLTTVRLMVVEMRTPTVNFVAGETKASPDHSWSSVGDGRWERAHTRMPLFFAEQREQLSVVVIWRGELWPKYNVTWVNSHRDVASESLGNKLVLRLSASPAVKPRLDDNP